MMVPAVKFPIFLCVRSLGVLVLILVLIWNVHYRGGLALFSDNKALLFNVHPVLMVIGLLLLNGEGIGFYISSNRLLSQGRLPRPVWRPGLLCTAESVTQRPTMRQVVRKLKQMLADSC